MTKMGIEGKEEQYFGLSMSEPYEKPVEKAAEPVAVAEPVKDSSLPF